MATDKDFAGRTRNNRWALTMTKFEIWSARLFRLTVLFGIALNIFADVYYVTAGGQ